MDGLRSSILIGLTLACAACAGWAENFTGTPEWFVHHRSGILKRASFDLSCPESDVTFTPLGTRTHDQGYYDKGDYSTLGASGCGKRATYVYAEGKWLMNSAEGVAAGEPSGAKASQGADDKISETARALLRDAKDSSKEFVFNQRTGSGPGLGHTRLTVDGKDVWPPAGEGCEALVSCCNERVANDDRFVLLCQLAVGRDGSCGAAQATLNKVASELELPPIDACGG